MVMVKNYIAIRINGKFSDWHKFGIQFRNMEDIPNYMVSINRNISLTNHSYDCFIDYSYFFLLGHGVYMMNFREEYVVLLVALGLQPKNFGKHFLKQ